MSSAKLIAGVSRQEDVWKYSTADNEIVFACIGDYGGATADETLVANLVKSWNPNAVFTTGDNTYNGAAYATDVGTDYQYFIDRAIFYPSLGNHDYSEDATGAPVNYFSYFADTVKNRYYYSSTIGPVTLFVLDSYSSTPDGNTVGSRQQEWFNAAVTACRSPWKIAIIHHAPYSSGSFHGSTEDSQWDFSGVDLVLSGHEHNYERLLVDGTYYIVNGIGGYTKYDFGDPIDGSQFRYNSMYGAGKLIATPTKLVWEFYSYDGVRVDSLIQEK